MAPKEYPVENKPKVIVGPGYVGFYDPAHPLANEAGLVYEHRHVASVKIGRWVCSDEDVHHIDGNRSNNLPDNLAVIPSGDHRRDECLAYCKRVGFVVNYLHPCKVCGKPTTNKVYCSTVCGHIAQRRVERPPREKLLELLKATSLEGLGRQFGVTGNAVRKWLRD